MVSISAITTGLKTVWRYGKKALEVAPELAFGTASESVGKVLKNTKGSVFTKAGWAELKNAGSGSFFKNFFKNCKNFIPEAVAAFKKGTGIKGKFGELFKNFGSKMPFIMSAIWILTEVPNVWTATKEQGIFQGAKEILKFGARMTTAGLGSAIGAALPIPFGSLIGWVAGEWIASRIVGKTYTEQKAEKEEMIAGLLGPQQQNGGQVPQQQEQQIQPQQFNPNPYWLNGQSAYQPQKVNPSFNGNMSNPFDYNQYKLQNMPYADDIMMKNMPFNVVA